ncbi:hypothetical protein SEPCBS119000_004057 [Sporothrix epigloea]|uniref:Uncharacterized protein n=1 Tax=Sporothrix epigloea TaxID=1892477 RepID=A0ABP0DU41_9PEZI
MAPSFDCTLLGEPEFWDLFISWVEQPAIQELLAQRPPAEQWEEESHLNDPGNSDDSDDSLESDSGYPLSRQPGRQPDSPPSLASTASPASTASLESLDSPEFYPLQPAPRQPDPQYHPSELDASQQDDTPQHVELASDYYQRLQLYPAAVSQHSPQPTAQGWYTLRILAILQREFGLDTVQVIQESLRTGELHYIAHFTNRERAELLHWSWVLNSLGNPAPQYGAVINGHLMTWWRGRRAIESIVNRAIYIEGPREAYENPPFVAGQRFYPALPTAQDVSQFLDENYWGPQDEQVAEDGSEELEYELSEAAAEHGGSENNEGNEDSEGDDGNEDNKDEEIDRDEENHDGPDDENEQGHMRHDLHDLAPLYTSQEMGNLCCELDTRLYILQRQMLDNTLDTLLALEQFERKPQRPPCPQRMRPKYCWPPLPRPEWGPPPAYQPSTMFTNPPLPSHMTSAHATMVPMIPELNRAHPHMATETTVSELDPLPPYPTGDSRVPRTAEEADELAHSGQTTEPPPAYFRTLALGDMDDVLVEQCRDDVARKRTSEPWMHSRKAILRRTFLMTRCLLQRAEDRHHVTDLYEDGLGYDFDLYDEDELPEEASSLDGMSGSIGEQQQGAQDLQQDGEQGEREEHTAGCIEERILSITRNIAEVARWLFWGEETEHT